MKQTNSRILIIHDGIELNTATGRSVRAIKDELILKNVSVFTSYNFEDAQTIIDSDSTIQCILLNWDDSSNKEHKSAISVLNYLRDKNLNLPVFLMADRSSVSKIPVNILERINDFIWILDDTPEFIVGRIFSDIQTHIQVVQPPMFKALKDFSDSYEYSWHTPGHSSGTAFLKSPIGREFYSFFGENIFRSDLSISVGKLGSLLDHTGPIGESEKYMARVFGSHKSYHVTNGSSASNRIILMASITRNQVILCDRNCHKSLEHALIMSGGIPNYLIPSRNHYGIIGPVKSSNMSVENINKAIKNNPLIDETINSKPVHAILTNSTYDGLCYNIKKVNALLGKNVDRLHYDEAWYAYAKFHPLYENFFAMSGKAEDHTSEDPTIFVTQSTHKLLVSFSQASMIHIRNGRNSIDDTRFNESFMMHSSTSPFYPIIASNDISTTMMDGPSGTNLIDNSIKEAISFRKTIAKLNDQYKNKNDWFFNAWQPNIIKNKDNKDVKFYDISDEDLSKNNFYWTLKSNDIWHGFGELEDNYCMLDPIKVSITTPGINDDGSLNEFGIPAIIVSSYLENKNIIVEKTTNFTILFLFSIGVSKGKWEVLLNALLEFKDDYDTNKPLENCIPNLVKEYKGLGLKDLVQKMYSSIKSLSITKNMKEAFSLLPHPDCTPIQAYENLVKGNIEYIDLENIANRTVATGVIPYPPGIPILLAGENIGNENSPILQYLKALEKFDLEFPNFIHDIHGVDVKNGKYKIACLKNI